MCVREWFVARETVLGIVAKVDSALAVGFGWDFLPLQCLSEIHAKQLRLCEESALLQPELFSCFPD